MAQPVRHANEAGTEEPDLVFDIGMHVGDDTAYYLMRGHRVVAVEANPVLVEHARARFPEALSAGRLRMVQAAVVGRSGAPVTFHLSQQRDRSSLDKAGASQGGYAGSIEVETLTLLELVRRFGLPLYCKIDIEGGDLDALRSLQDASVRPRYISVETGGLPGEPAVYGGEGALATLEQLERLGYARFKLVDQHTLQVLRPRRRFYSRSRTPLDRLADLMHRPRETWRRRALYHRLGHHFSHSSSGPFGEDLGGRWLDYDAARRLLLYHAADYLATPAPPRVSYLCDWHAKRA
jgi:FkbM family methyltransferase